PPTIHDTHIRHLSTSVFLMIPPPPSSTLFPYTTLFRSLVHGGNRPGSISQRRNGLRAADTIDVGDPCPTCRRQHQRIDGAAAGGDRKSTRLNSSHVAISYAVFCLKKKNIITKDRTQEIM